MRSFSISAALAVVVLAAVPAAQQSPTIEMIDLGAPASDEQVFPAAINSSGVIAGTIDVNISTYEHRYRAFTWTRSGGFRILVHNAQAADINDRGVVVGRRFGAGMAPGFSWSPTQGVRDLSIVPDAINNRGDVLGYCDDIRSWCVRNGAMTIRLPAGFLPTDINDRRAVSGYYRRASDAARRPAVWAPSFGVRDLDEINSPEGLAYAINEHGLVAGESLPVIDGRIRAEAAVWTPLGRSAWPAVSVTWSISNRGWVVGQTGGWHPAFWWLGRRLVRLPVPDDAFGASIAVDVNDAGQIVGVFGRQDIGQRAVLWIVR